VLQVFNFEKNEEKKMKTKKTVIAVLLAVLMISAALIAGCSNPVDGLPDQKDFENIKAPVGKGVVRLKITDTGVNRTVLPTSSLSTMRFVIEFTPVVNGTAFSIPADILLDTKPLLSALPSPATLEEGDYTVTITGFNNAGTVPIASWESASGAILIDNSVPATVEANLKGKIDSLVDGYLNYSITLPGVGPAGDSTPYTISTLRMDTYGTTDGVINKTLDLGANNLSGTGSGTNFRPGYYLLRATVGETGYQPKEYVRIVHIYPTMTSTVDTIIIPALVKNSFTVTFTTDDGVVDVDGTDLNNYSNKTVGYGNKVPAFGANPIPDDITYSFGGWRQGSLSGGAWAFATDRVTADTNLFVKWNAPGVSNGDADFDITFNFSDAATASATDDTISRAALYSGTTYTLSLGTAPGSGAWNNITWSTAAGTIITNAHVSGGNFVISDSADFNPFIITGQDFEVTVTATLSGSDDDEYPDGTYSGTVEMTVTN
jgi:hypothetical protein